MILTVKEYALHFKVSESTVYAHWQELGGFKIAGSIRFNLDDGLQQRDEAGNTLVLPVHQGGCLPSGRGMPNQAGGFRRRALRKKLTLPASSNGLW